MSFRKASYPPVQHIEIDKLFDSPFQPRKEYRKIDELAQSIKTVHLREPILVRPRADGTYEVVHGHRRLRALKLLNAKYAPCYIETLTDKDAVEIGLNQNIQNEDLNPIEEAGAFKQYKDMFSCSDSELARRIGRSRDFVYERLCLLGLPEDVRNKISDGTLSFFLARELIGLPVETTHNLVGSLESKEIKSRDELKGSVQLVKFGLPIEDAKQIAIFRENQRVVAKRMVGGFSDLKVVLKGIQDAQQGSDVIKRAFLESNLQIVKKMISEGALVCPFCKKSHFVCGECGRGLE